MKDLIIKYLRRAADVALPVESRQSSQLIQRSLFCQYREISARGGELPSFADTGFRVYSQCDEDGLLLHIFSLIGFKNRLLLDVASGAPIGGNTTNLIVNWNCHALLLESDANLVEAARLFYTRHADTEIFPPRIQQAWITAENINQLVAKEGFSGEIDLFSLDVDGVDYWLWQSLDVVSPRVVMVEYQDMFSADETYTIPYHPEFDRFSVHPDYFGASLAAFVKLAHRKGYHLVGCNRYGYNAFFVRNDITCPYLPEISIDSCLRHPKIVESRDDRRSAVMGFTWEVV